MNSICESCDRTAPIKLYKDLRDADIYEVDERTRVWCKDCTDDDYTEVSE